MQDIFIVAKFTIRDLVGRKSFRISTLIVLALIVLGFNLPNILQSFDDGPVENTVLVSDPTQVFAGQAPTLNQVSTYHFTNAEDDHETIKQQINQGEATAAVVVSKENGKVKLTYLAEHTSVFPEDLMEQLSGLYTSVQLNKLPLNEQQLQSLVPDFAFAAEATSDTVFNGNPLVMMLLSMVLFFAIYFCAFQVSSSITTEKTSKIIETLVTSTSPRTIVLGKTIGVGLVGLGQIILFATTAVVSAYSFLDGTIIDAILGSANLTPLLVVVMLVYFILGYATYALLYALVGSTVSKPEDVQSANVPVTFLTMIGFYLAYFTLVDPTGPLNAVAALLPISSPFCMPLRVMMGVASFGEVALSIAILIATCAVVAHIAIRIYSNAILNYGTKLSFKDIIRTYKES